MAFAAELEVLTYMRSAVVVESCTGNVEISPEEAGHVHKKLC